ncbi:MAG: N-acetylmuramic acid 6-phosphate etherase [Acidobacteriota bacterium]|nr:N-acetylmuramic acid 6-phosphate etherase [Acidobacteriota bacterium]MDE3146448.1 N-acetylmuramic acid 6-phosphate etherase [Acidobacteriota bacterium]
MSQPRDAATIRRLGTEQIRPELARLDEMSVGELVDLMCHDVRRVPDALREAEGAITTALTDLVDRLERGGRLIYVGAGTAGRLGMLDAAEAGPTFNVRDGQVIGVMAGGLSAFGVPQESVEDDADGGARAVRDLEVGEADCVVGISASGRTPFVLGAVAEANERGALTVGISCNHATPLSAAVRHPIEVAVGPEVIAGSTRMNSGTAQKLVLNILSTAAMVRLGKTYGNLMVDLRPTNEKLRYRSLRIVAEITGASDGDVSATLDACQWRPKVAAVMIVGGVDAATAEEMLGRHHGRLRATLDALEPRGEGSRRGPDASRRLGVAAAFVDGELVEGDVEVDAGRIVGVGLPGEGRGIAVAGFVDAQINGYFGIDLLNADVEEILAMGEALARDGVVAYQPTLITSDIEQLRRATARVAEARRRVTSGARILGTHLEGPFLSSRRAGTHPVNHLRAPDPDLLATLLDLEGVTMMTIAPELPGALDLIRTCVARGVTVSLGHSAATGEEAQRGFDAGATAVTHLYNAMEPMSARSPGLAGAALSRPGIAVQVIADGVHVSEEMLRMTFAAAAQRCILVSDAIAAAGVERTVVQLGDVTVLINDGEARRVDGTLAGSIGKLRDGLTHVRSQGVDVLDALRAVISRPARLTGADDLVSLRPGRPANLLILDHELRITRRVENGVVLDPT